jgi:hypothetical protein
MDSDDEFVPPANSVGNAIYKVLILSQSLFTYVICYEQLCKIVRHTRSSPQCREAWKVIARKHLDGRLPTKCYMSITMPFLSDLG